MAEGRLTEFTLAKVIQLVKQKSSMADCRVYSFHQPLGCISLNQDQPPPMKVSMFANPKSQCSSSQDETRAQQRCKQTDCSSRTSPWFSHGALPCLVFQTHCWSQKLSAARSLFFLEMSWLAPIFVAFIPCGPYGSPDPGEKSLLIRSYAIFLSFGDCPSHQRGIISCITLRPFKELWNILFLLGLLFLSVESMSIWHWMTL